MPKFLGNKCTRHSDAPYLFREIIKQNKLRRENAVFADVVLKAVSMKSGADYGKESFSVKQARDLLAEARHFVEMAHSYV